jgi:hypothetical protein
MINGTVVASPPRSKASKALVTFHPSFGAPTMQSADVRASVKKTSLKSRPPAAFEIGRTSTPG